MNEANKDANGYIQVPPRRSKSSNNPPSSDAEFESAQSECGLMHHNQFDEVPQSGNVYTSLRARKMALRRKRSLSGTKNLSWFFKIKSNEDFLIMIERFHLLDFIEHSSFGKNVLKKFQDFMKIFGINYILF